MTSLSQPVLSHLEWTTRAFCIYLSFGDMRDDRYATASSLDVKDVIRPAFFGLGCGIHVECISSSHRRMFCTTRIFWKENEQKHFCLSTSSCCACQSVGLLFFIHFFFHAWLSVQREPLVVLSATRSGSGDCVFWWQVEKRWGGVA